MFLKRLAHAGTVFFVALSSLVVCVFCCAQGSSSTGTTTFLFDGNRMYAELGFVRPNGSIHQALAFVDMGSPSMTLTESLFKELQLDQNKPLLFRVGELSVDVPRADVICERSEPYSVGSDLKVEGMLPAGILQRYQVVTDYQKRTLTFTQSRTVKPQGVAVPFHINQETGLIAVDALIDGKTYPITIDNGSAYTWLRQSTAKNWLVAHPEWVRGVGAVGASNMMMSGDGTETSGILLRIPEISLGSLILKDVGALAAGPGGIFPENLDLFDWYSQKNATLVIGWIGGNILKQFRLTIDYPNRMMYWLKQSDPDSHDLDQVGLTLRSEHREYFVVAVAKKNGRPTVEGVSSGDRLIRIGDLETRNATWGAITTRCTAIPEKLACWFLSATEICSPSPPKSRLFNLTVPCSRFSIGATPAGVILRSNWPRSLLPRCRLCCRTTNRKRTWTTPQRLVFCGTNCARRSNSSRRATFMTSRSIIWSPSA